MKPFPIDEVGLTFGQVLKDTGKRLFEEAKRLAQEGLSEQSALFTRSSIIMQDAAKLPHKEFLQSAESIAKGLLYGTAAIAEEKARAFWQNLIKNSFQYAASLAGGVLDLAGGAGNKPAKKRSKKNAEEDVEVEID